MVRIGYFLILGGGVGTRGPVLLGDESGFVAGFVAGFPVLGVDFWAYVFTIESLFFAMYHLIFSVANTDMEMMPPRKNNPPSAFKAAVILS